MKLGTKVIVHLGYGFLAEMVWTKRGWFGLRCDGPHKPTPFTDDERKAAMVKA